MLSGKTSRRGFIAGSAAAIAAMQLPAVAATHALALPSNDQLAWQDLEVGMFVHFAPNTWQDKEGDNLSTPLSEINPDIDTDNWAQCAVNLGAKYIVFVAKHVGGFCMWQTKTTPYSIAHTPWKNGTGDVMADVSASCKKFGLGLGVYLSPRDDYFGAGLSGICKDPAKQPAYNAMYREQLTEVLSRYGSMVEVWFDGSSVVPVADILKKYAPHASIFQGPSATIRWVGNEDGFAPLPLWNAVSTADAKSGTATSLLGDPDGQVWLPNECDVSIRRPNWFWSTTNVKHLLSLDALLEIYYRSVGRGAQLLLNIPADRAGHMPPEDFARAKEFGDAIRRRFATPVASTHGVGAGIELPLLPAQPAVPAGRAIDEYMRVNFPADTVILQEDCRYGQRVLAFRLEGRDKIRNSGAWFTLYTGNSISHKRIIPFASQNLSALRLVITDSLGTPHIRSFAAFNTYSVPPATWDAPARVYAPNGVGRWQDSKFSLDLSRHITAATEYRLRFLSETGAVTALENLQLLVDGVPSPHLLRRVPGSRNMLMLNMTEIPQHVVLSGTVAGASGGAITLQKQ